MAISKRDRSHFAALGEFKASSHARLLAEHLALPLAERLEKSWALFETFADARRHDREASGAIAFYDRARVLNLIRQ
jgi:hypothetical protein